VHASLALCFLVDRHLRLTAILPRRYSSQATPLPLPRRCYLTACVACVSCRFRTMFGSMLRAMLCSLKRTPFRAPSRPTYVLLLYLRSSHPQPSKQPLHLNPPARGTATPRTRTRRPIRRRGTRATALCRRQVCSSAALSTTSAKSHSPCAGGASDLFPSGPALLPGPAGIGAGGMIIGLLPSPPALEMQPSASVSSGANAAFAGPRNFPRPLGGPHFGIPAPGSGAPRFDPYGPPDLHEQPQLPRNYGDAFAPPQPTNDLFLPPGGGMWLPHMGGGRGGAYGGRGGRGGGGLGPFGGGGFM
jgi:hypothetical protein